MGFPGLARGGGRFRGISLKGPAGTGDDLGFGTLKLFVGHLPFTVQSAKITQRESNGGGGFIRSIPSPQP